jgi:hypothetical protein
MEIFAATAKEFFLRSQWLTASKRARNEHGTETLSWMQDVDGGWMADGCRMGVGNPAGVCQTGYCTVAKAIIAIVKEPARGHMALRPQGCKGGGHETKLRDGSRFGTQGSDPAIR